MGVRATHQRGILRRAFGWIVRLGLVGALCGLAAGAGLLWYYGRDLPRLITLDDYRPKRASVVLARDGQVLARFGIERRTVVPVERVPQVLRHAVIATEDGDFYRHKGLDYAGMARAFVALVRHGRITQGGSTITQQLIKTLMLSPERTFSRKAKEILLARQLESNLTKDEILHLYLNQIYLGHGTYGVEEASRLYFGHGVEQVDVGEAALLAGLIQSPERLSPLRHPEAARTRRRYVLNAMVDCEYLDRATADALDAAPLGASRHRDPEAGLAPHFVDAVRREVVERWGSERLLEGGLRIETTLDPRLQRAAEAAVTAGLDDLDRRQHSASLPLPSAKKAAAELAAALKQRKGAPPRSGQVVLGRIEGYDRAAAGYRVDLGGGVAGLLPLDALERYLDPAKGKPPARRRGRKAPAPKPSAPQDLLAPGSLGHLRVVEGGGEGPDAPLRLQPAFGPESALVALDPFAREVLALVGGDPRSGRGYDRALQAKRQPGSAFKPFVYLAALALRSRDTSPASLWDDTPLPLPGAGGREWTPRNYDRRYRGRIRLREALADSVNVVAVRLLQRAGVERVISLAHQLGIESDLDPYFSLALGGSVVRPLELSNAYASLAAGGKAADPVLLRRVVTPEGEVLKEWHAELRPVLEEDVACLMVDLLRTVVEEGTGRSARLEGRQVAGKTGTTNGQTDAWFAGFVPQLVAVVWVGHDDNRSLGRKESGGRSAGPIWARFMAEALEGSPAESFGECPDVVVRSIDRATGLLAPPGHPASETLSERFLAGTEPTEVLALPGELTTSNFLLEQTGVAGGADEGSDDPPEAGDGPVAGAAEPSKAAGPAAQPGADPLAPPPGDPLAPPAPRPAPPPEQADPLAPPPGED